VPPDSRDPPRQRLCKTSLKHPLLQRLCEDSRNPTHGSGWIVHAQPTDEGDSIASLNTTHGSGWIVHVQPTDESDSIASLNTTHGSGWIVQVQPTKRAGADLCFVVALPCGATEGAEEKRESRYALRCRLDLNDPPTAMGGIRGAGESPFPL
jgi:hypothetical protein